MDVEAHDHWGGVYRHLRVNLVLAMTGSFLLVLLIGVASADEIPSSEPASPVGESVIELASAVVVAADADSIDTNAVARIASVRGDDVAAGTGFQLDDGRIVTVAHAVVDARSVRFGTLDDAVVIEDVNTNPDVAINRLHDLAALPGSPLPGSLTPASTGAAIGEGVALAGIPRDGRIVVMTGEIIARTDGNSYGLGRPEVYAIASTVDVGFSGGPVVNASGEVIAVIVGTETVSGVTLAVPIEHLPALD